MPSDWIASEEKGEAKDLLVISCRNEPTLLIVVAVVSEIDPSNPFFRKSS